MSLRGFGGGSKDWEDSEIPSSHLAGIFSASFTVAGKLYFPLVNC